MAPLGQKPGFDIKPTGLERPLGSTVQGMRSDSSHTVPLEQTPRIDIKPKPTGLERPSVSTAQVMSRGIRLAPLEQKPGADTKPKPTGLEKPPVSTAQVMSRGSGRPLPLEQKPIFVRSPKPIIVRPARQKPIKPPSPVYFGDKRKLYEFFEGANRKLIDAVMEAYDKKDFSITAGSGAPLSYLESSDINRLHDYIYIKGCSTIKEFIKEFLPSFRASF